MIQMVDTGLRELAFTAIGSQDAGSHNRVFTFYCS